MVSLIQINPSRLKEFVTIGFAGDVDLVEKYHTVGGSYEKCVDSNVKNVLDSKDDYKLSIYAVYLKGELPMGFTVVGKNLLYSFGINVKYRTPELLESWMASVKHMLGNSFVCVLYDKNERAIEFMKKNGLRITLKLDGITYLEYNNHDRAGNRIKATAGKV